MSANEEMNEEIREEEISHSTDGAAEAVDDAGEGTKEYVFDKNMKKDDDPYRFIDTSSIKQVHTGPVHMVSETSTTDLPIITREGKKRIINKKRLRALVIPLSIIMVYILMLVISDILGLVGFRFRFTLGGAFLYILYLGVSFVGVVLFMFMDVMPKPLALSVIFVSIFCMNGNLIFIIPLVISFVAIALTIEGLYAKIITLGIGLLLLVFICILCLSSFRTKTSENIYSADGRYILILETTEHENGYTYQLVLEDNSTIYKKRTITTDFVDIYYFGEGETVAYGVSNQFGQPQKIRTVLIEDVVKNRVKKSE